MDYLVWVARSTVQFMDSFDWVACSWSTYIDLDYLGPEIKFFGFFVNFYCIGEN